MKSAHPSLTWRTLARYAVVMVLGVMLANLVLNWSSGEALIDSDNFSWKEVLLIGLATAICYLAIAHLARRLVRTEAALRKQEKQWRLTLTAAGDCVWEADLGGAGEDALYLCNGGQVFGHTLDGTVQTVSDWRRLIHPDDAERVDRELREFLAGAEPHYRSEYRMHARDGSYRWVLSRARVVGRPGQQDSKRMIGTHTDITVRKQAESAVEEAARHHERLFEANPSPVWVYDRATLMLLQVNEAAVSKYGYTREQFLRMTILDLRAPEEVPALLESLRENAAPTQASGPWRHRKADGSELLVEINSRAIEWKGRPARFVLVNDVTEQKKTIARLNLLQAALQAAPVGWVITDRAGLIEWVNPAFTQLTGYLLEEMTGKNPSVLKSGLHPPEFYAQMWQTIRRGEVWKGDLHNRRKDGTLYDEHMVIAPVRDERGDIAHFVAMKHDATVERLLEKQLVRAQQLESIGILASGIAHDLNNVLAPIILGMGMLKAEASNPVTRERLDLVERAAQRGAGVVKQLLTFARGGVGERACVQLRYLVKEVAELAQETFPREIEIAAVTGAGVSPVLGDVTQLHQVLLNLAVNARDAMPHGGRLTFGLHNVRVEPERAKLTPGLRAGNCVELSVADTGTGISAEVLEHLFDPFFTTKPQGKGTGLGLSTVYGIVRSHGGGVTVETEVGRGSTFRLLLPELAAPAAEASNPVAVANALNGAGRWILVVDDEEPIRKVVKEMLTRRGFRVVTAEDGVQAVQLFLLRPSDYSVAIVDMMMPRMNGTAVVEELRSRVPELPVIRCSGIPANVNGQEGTDPHLQKPGFDAFLPKPFSEAQLMTALNNAFAYGSGRVRE